MILTALTVCMLLPAQSAFADGAERTYELASSADLIKTVGRTAADENGIYVAWSYSGIAFSGEFGGDVKLTASCVSSVAGYLNIAVVVDGAYALPRRYAIHKGENTYTIATVEQGTHTIEIFKLNEAARTEFGGTLLFRALSLNGTLTERPADKPMQIEFVGDSLTCGFGIYPAGGQEDYPAVPGKVVEEEDSYYTYAALLARALHADASFISLSGWGVTQGNDDPALNVPSIYDKVCGVSGGVCLSDWDFVNHQVDLVICNQGTNDWLMWNEGGEARLKKGIADFCRTLRQRYPNAEIIWCYGMMHTLMEETIQSAVNSVNDAKLHYLTLPTNTSGGAKHADFWGQEAAAQALLAYWKTLGMA